MCHCIFHPASKKTGFMISTHRRTAGPAALVIILSTILGCGSRGTSTGTTAEFTDALGRTVRIATPVQRIVTMAPNLTEITFAAGAGERVVGVTTADDFPPEIADLPRFSAVGVDFEAVASFEPDVVFATDQVNSVRDAETFAALGIPIYFFHFSTFADVLGAIRTVGAIAGSAQRATEHAATLEEAIEDLKRQTSRKPATPRVLLLISSEPLFGFGKDSYVHDLIAAAGGRSISENMDVPAPVFSDEYVIEERPDVIIGAFETDTDAEQLLTLHPAWGTVPAIKNGRVYAINPDLILRPGPRLVEGAYRIALFLHPDLFGADTSELQP